MHDLIVDSCWFEEAQLVLGLALSVLTAEEVDSFDNCIGLSRLKSDSWFFRFLRDLDVTAPTLNEGRHSILNLEFIPLVVV